jgi:hypothetical protein
VRSFLKTLLGSLASVCLFLVLAFVWVAECQMPSDLPKRGLVTEVTEMEEAELKSTGKVGDIEAEITSGNRHPFILDTYRVVTRKVTGGYDVLIEPRSWCFCRKTYIIHNGGARVEVVGPISRVFGQ